MALREHILLTLQELQEDDFKMFKWYLREPEYLEGHKPIPRSELASADRLDTADLMVEAYPGAVPQIMKNVLRKINKNDLVKTFTTNISQGQSRDVAPASGSGPPTEHSKHQSPSTSTGSAASAGDRSREPQTREDFLQYARQLSVNLNTVHNWVRLSEKNRKVTLTAQEYQSYHASPERFTLYTQALCTEGLTGRCYWEVKWNGKVVVAVSYNDIHRDDSESLFGNDDRSWGLICSDLGFALKHKKFESQVCGPRASRVVGVYLDHSAGTLSFYSVELDGMSLIHTVKTSFTRALHPGLGPHEVVGSAGELREIQ